MKRLFALAALVALAGCRVDAWRDAEAKWRARDPSAFAAWRALDGASPAGQDAQRRLTSADAHFRRGIELLATDDDAARRELEAGFADGPIDPALYLPLARASATRGLTQRAADLYRKYLHYALASAVDRDTAEHELAALERDALAGVFDEPRPTPIASPLLFAALAIAAAASVLLVIVLWRRRRAPTLAELARTHPELQPAIAFLVGNLRHELLKHRILALGDAVTAIGTEREQSGQRRFLISRLQGGEPLVLAWAGHLGAMLRALGPQFDLLRTDDEFGAADRAIHRLTELLPELETGRAPTFVTLRRAYAQLGAFDRYLATLLGSLVRLRVDRTLVASIVDDVQSERGARPPVAVELGAIADDVEVEMFRVDFVLVLRNLLRNACAAAEEVPEPRVLVELTVAIEATGDEIVELALHDTSPRPLPTLVPRRSLGRGLDLVLRVLDRAGGSLAPATARPGYQKAVLLRLFRTLSQGAELPAATGEGTP